MASLTTLTIHTRKRWPFVSWHTAWFSLVICRYAMTGPMGRPYGKFGFVALRIGSKLLWWRSDPSIDIQIAS